MIGHPLKISELLDEIDRGDVVLPEIQRGYVWRGPQVSKLLDSLYHEYPVGQILLWDTTIVHVVRDPEGVQPSPLPRASRPKVILDGQQRLTSLYKALGEKPSEVNIYFNLDIEQFQRYSGRMKADQRWIAVRDVINGKLHDLDILETISEAGLATKTQKKLYADRLQKLRRIAEYKLPIEIFRSDDYEQVTELFVRVNSAGTRLHAAELALAQLVLRLPGALVSRFEQAIEEYSDVRYELDARFLIRAFIAMGTGQSRFRYLTEFWKKNSKELEEVWKRTRRGVDAAVNFTRNNAHFESSEWLPSLNALIPLAVFFEKHARIAKDVEIGLLRWFYVASLRGRYSGSAETALDEDLRSLQEGDPVEQLMKRVAPTSHELRVTADEFDDAGMSNSLFPLTYAAARKAGAKDWFSGVKLSSHVVGRDHEIEIHHIFPKALLTEAKVHRRDRDEIANLAFLTARPNKQISRTSPTKYLSEIADKHPERLKAQWIPDDRTLWSVERFHDFLTERRKLLSEAVTELIASPA